MAFLSQNKLQDLFGSNIGTGCLISEKATFYGIDKIIIGNNVRIDDFCVISAGAGLVIKNYIHVGAHSCIIGQGELTIHNYANISGKVFIYTSNDDYTGEFMTNPMVNEQFTGVEHGTISILKHVIIGCGSVILPNVWLSEGCAIGALTLVKSGMYKKNSIYAGNPIKYIKQRSCAFLEEEKKFIAWKNSQN